MTTKTPPHSRQVYRYVNENIEAIHLRLGIEELELLCECGNPECARRMVVSPAAYDAVRLHPLRFLVASAHRSAPEGEIVDSGADYLVVEVQGPFLPAEQLAYEEQAAARQARLPVLD